MLETILQIHTGTALYSLCSKFSVKIYGLFALLSVVFLVIFSSLDFRRKNLLDLDSHISMITWTTFATIAGARVLHVFSNHHFFIKSPVEILKVWDGGLSLMGGVVAAVLAGKLLSHLYKINFLAFADLISTYAPALQAIARLGCLFAGCCYGDIAPEGITLPLLYTNPESLAPTGIPLYPSQFYSIIASLVIFGIMLIAARKFWQQRGLIFFGYLTLEGAARSLVDMYRGDRNMLKCLEQLGIAVTASQLVSILVMIFGAIGLIFIFTTHQENTAASNQLHDNI